ncbi:hypothetical protein EBU91_02600 [bacterium]|nr:hypothetical protein [bacterium]
MSDLIGCLLKLGVLAGLLILLWHVIVLGFFFWILNEIAGIKTQISISEFAFFALGAIVFYGLVKKR